MHFGNSFVVRFANDGENGRKGKVFNDFVDGGQNDVGGIDHGSMTDDGEIKLVTTEDYSQTDGRPLRRLKTLLLI